MEEDHNSDFDPLIRHTGWDTLHTREHDGQVHVHSTWSDSDSPAQLASVSTVIVEEPPGPS